MRGHITSWLVACLLGMKRLSQSNDVRKDWCPYYHFFIIRFESRVSSVVFVSPSLASFNERFDPLLTELDLDPLCDVTTAEEEEETLDLNAVERMCWRERENTIMRHDWLAGW